MNLLAFITSASEKSAVSGEGFCDVWLFVFTLIALIFVATEYAAEHLKWPWGHERRHLFAIGVIVGFAGELVFEIGSFGYAYRLQSLQAAHIGELEDKAGAAKTKADAANVSAGKALTSGADATNAASNALGVANAANLLADEAVRKLAPLVSAATWRHVTPEQIEAFRRSFAKLPLEAVGVRAVLSDKETIEYHWEILLAFQKAGVKNPSMDTPFAGLAANNEGLYVMRSPDRAANLALEAALCAAHLRYRFGALSDEQIPILFVGTKPHVPINDEPCPPLK